jgi:hypothetical protein
MTLPPTDIPPTAVAGFEKLSDANKELFGIEFAHKKRSMALMVALSILFPLQLFFLGRVGLGILFLLTGGGFGIWYVIEWFLTPGRVRDYNTSVAREILARLDTAA